MTASMRIDLEHCYGIKKLEHEFDFSNNRSFAIYAPNGSMKSSFAQTFEDIALGNSSKDRIFPDRNTSRTVVDSEGNELPPENVVVIQPYDEVYGHTEKTSTLLVDSTLRTEYENLHKDIDEAKNRFLKKLKEQSGTKKNIEEEVSATFTRSSKNFFIAVNRIESEIQNQEESPFDEVRYDVVFDDKVLAFLNTKDFQTAINDYVEKYNELLDESTYFKRGVFNYYNAETIAKNLADNGFFDANHTVNLNAEEITEIKTRQELEELINQEKEAISTDEELKKKFAEIDKQLNRNVTLRTFRDYLQDNQELVANLANVEQFREDVWKSYIVSHKSLYKELVKTVKAADERKKEIEEAAKGQKTQWEDVIEIFNNRFFVPFSLEAKNREAVILGYEPLLELGFTFKDGEDKAELDKNELLKSLSTGEKKALYILNIIFEVEARKKSQNASLFVIDDIADSFDYKNKYAIVEYLREISEEEFFNSIILTHNFDFFRTITNRVVAYSNCLMAFKSDGEISLRQATGINNIFVNDWKNDFYNDNKKKIASIPFMRNILEYTKGQEDDGFVRLTSLLHRKQDSDGILVTELHQLFNSMFDIDGEDSDQPVLELIEETAKECLTADEGVNFENKVVLSIAIRLNAEKYMIDKIDDHEFVSSIVKNQTIKLFTKFKEIFSDDRLSIDTLQRVVLMTPESIHLNSFMYEPILDMSDEHLKQLYSEVEVLT